MTTPARPARAASLAPATALPALTALQPAPVVSTIGPPRNTAVPRLTEQGRPDRIALTFGTAGTTCPPGTSSGFSTRGVRVTGPLRDTAPPACPAP